MDGWFGGTLEGISNVAGRLQEELGSAEFVGLLLRLRAAGIMDPEFCKVVESVPRDHFVPIRHHPNAWSEEWLPIECGQSMPPPDLTIKMVHWLNVEPRHAVLEIGTGSGYQTALLARLARKVRTIERYATLLEAAGARLKRLDISNVTLFQADGREGTKHGDLYDRIIADCAFPEPPRALGEQLVAGGCVVTAIGPPDGEQMLVHLTKIGSRFERVDLMPVRFPPFEENLPLAL